MNNSNKEKSLYSVRPDLAGEWDFERNYPLTPHDVFAHSNKKAWWICPQDHSYYACINNRSN